MLAGMRVRALVVGMLVTVATGCTPYQQYDYKPAKGPATRMQPVKAQVVSAEDAARAGLRSQPLVVPFRGDADGTHLVEDFLGRADAAGAKMVSALAIYLHSDADGRALECRTEIVPETVTRSEWTSARYDTVPVQRPVTRTVTEYEHRCHTVMRSRMTYRTEYQQRCHMVSHPVTHTRTTYSTQYDSYSHSSRSVPHTESYTTYEYRNECHSEPVSRMVNESVPEQDCHSEPVTRTVTRYEFQLESRYVPPRLETITRQRLRELEPVCYDVGAGSEAPGATDGDRIEGTLHLPR